MRPHKKLSQIVMALGSTIIYALGSTSWIQNTGISTFKLTRDFKQHFLTDSMQSSSSATEENRRPKTVSRGDFFLRIRKYQHECLLYDK